MPEQDNNYWEQTAAAIRDLAAMERKYRDELLKQDYNRAEANTSARNFIHASAQNKR